VSLAAALLLLGALAHAGEAELETARGRSALAEQRYDAALEHAWTSLNAQVTPEAQALVRDACAHQYDADACRVGADSDDFPPATQPITTEALSERAVAKRIRGLQDTPAIEAVYAALEQARAQRHRALFDACAAELARRGEPKPLLWGEATPDAHRALVRGMVAAGQTSVDDYELDAREALAIELAAAFQSMGRTAQADATLRSLRAHRDSPALSAAHVDLLARMGKGTEALAVAQAGLALARTPAELGAAWLGVGQMEARAERPDRALVSLRVANSLAPSADGLALLGQVELALGDRPAAFTSLCAAAKLGAQGVDQALEAAWRGPGAARIACDAVPQRDTQ